MNIEGTIIRLRAVEPEDIDLLYAWENDSSLWSVSGTTEPFSREQMARFVERQLGGGDLRHTGQLRLMIETKPVARPELAPEYPGHAATGADRNAAGCTPGDSPRQTDTHAAPTECPATVFSRHDAADRPGDTRSVSSRACASEAPEHSLNDASDLSDGCGRPTKLHPSGTVRTVGAIDLFEYDPVARRAGIGILVHGSDDRRRGYASDAVETLCRYAREVLDLHQLWCNVGTGNEASLRLFRRAGFVECGILRDWHRTPHGYEDEAILQRIL